MKISLDQTDVHDLGDFKASFYVKKEDGRGFNALLVDCVTRHYKTRLIGSTRGYLILDGVGTFTINGDVQQAKQHDLFLIGSGDEYRYEGKMRLFEFNVPATDAVNEERLD